MTALEEVLPVLDWFREVQVEKLAENVEKVHWDWMKRTRLVFLLNCEFNELTIAMAKKDVDGAIRECADIANFAMMVADKLKNHGFDDDNS